MPPSSDVGQYKCAGTKRISIIEGEYSSSDGDAQISVYYWKPADSSDANNGNGRRSPPYSRLSNGSNSTGRLSGGSTFDDDCLHVFIADGVHTFYQSIAPKDIRHMPSEEGNELETVSAILLRPDDEIFKVSYKRQRGQLLGGTNDSKNTTSIKVSIRKTCLNNVVRPVWEGQMNNLRHAYYDDLPIFARNAFPDSAAQSESSSGLASPLMLGDTINKLHKEIDALRTENKQLEANTLRWKSTSEKLSNQWEDEKSELTARFLKLFNEHKARHVETFKELERLKGKKQRTTMASTASSSITRKSRDNLLPNDEDEHDFMTYNDDEINRLAAGPNMKKRNGTNQAAAAAAAAAASSSMTQESGFVNPHTGAREFGNVQELFSSDSEDENMKM